MATLNIKPSINYVTHGKLFFHIDHMHLAPNKNDLTSILFLCGFHSIEKSMKKKTMKGLERSAKAYKVEYRTGNKGV